MVHSFAVSVPKMPAASTPMATNRDLRLSAGLDAGRCAEPGGACMDPLTRPPKFPRLDFTPTELIERTSFFTLTFDDFALLRTTNTTDTTMTATTSVATAAMMAAITANAPYRSRGVRGPRS